MSKIIFKCRGCGFEARNEDQLHRFRPSDVKRGKGYCRVCHKERLQNNLKLKLYYRWHLIIRRCYNPENDNFHNYGARGITVCDEWRNNKQVFIDWALTHGFKSGLTIDRINNNGPYSPENCRWITHLENQRHKDKQFKRRKIKLQ